MTPARLGIIIALLSTVLLGATGAVVYRFSGKTTRTTELAPPTIPTEKSFQPDATNDSEVLSDWKTYVTNGYSIEYPGSLKIVIPKLEGRTPSKHLILTDLPVREDGVPKTFLYEEPGGIGGTGFTIQDGFWLRIEGDSSEQPDDVIDNVRSANKNATRLTVGGKEAYRSERQNEGGGYTGMQIWVTVINGRSIYFIRVEFRSGIKDYSSLFQEILSTLTFTISNQEKLLIDAWLQQNNLNQYGDPKDRVYAGGTPLFDERTGERTDRYDYIVKKYPERPWNR